MRVSGAGGGYLGPEWPGMEGDPVRFELVASTGRRVDRLWERVIEYSDLDLVLVCTPAGQAECLAQAKDFAKRLGRLAGELHG